MRDGYEPTGGRVFEEHLQAIPDDTPQTTAKSSEEAPLHIMEGPPMQPDNVTQLSPQRGREEGNSAPPARFLIQSPGDIQLDTACNEYIIKTIFDKGDTAVMYGPSGCGKTFLALDMARHIAAGKEFLGRKVKQSKVLYITLEGHRGFAKRVKAIEDEGGFGADDPFHFACAKGTDFDDAAFRENVISCIKSGAYKIVVIDTLARFLNAEDENTSAGMMKALSFADEISARTEAATLFVHHSGKDAQKGARGHSSLRAAVDAELLVNVDAETKTRTVELAKVKDGEDGQKFDFNLRTVSLGFDDEGDEMTTCMVAGIEPANATKKKPRQKPTPNQTKGWELINAHLVQKGEKQTVEPNMGPVLSSQRANIFQALEEGGFFGDNEAAGNSRSGDFPDTKTKRNKMQSLLLGLQGRELLNFNRDYVWLTEHTEPKTG